MTANSHEALVAGAIFGVVGLLILQGIIHLVREWRFAEASVEKAADILGTPIPAPSDYRSAQVGHDERHWSECDDFTDHLASALAEHTEQFQRRLSSVAPVVPLQRDQRGS